MADAVATRDPRSAEGEGLGQSRLGGLERLAFATIGIADAFLIDPGVLDLPAAPPERKRVRIIPSRAELVAVFSHLRGSVKLMAALMYGSGLRVDECCQLRVKDIDFEALTIRIHGGKGDKDRLTLLPALLVPALRRQLAWRTALHERDLADGAGLVELPGRLAFKYKSAPRELRWQYLFPSQNIVKGHRWHTVPETPQRAMKTAVTAAATPTLTWNWNPFRPMPPEPAPQDEPAGFEPALATRITPP